MSFTVGIIIISDRAFAGEREDGCLSIFNSILDREKFTIKESTIVSDNPQMIKNSLSSFINRGYQLIFTSGGTGCGSRDVTPEITSQLLDKATPGVDEAIRAFSRDKSPFAIYSRAVSGVAKKSFIINLPGSPRAVAQILEFLLPTIEHPLQLIAGEITDCTPETN